MMMMKKTFNQMVSLAISQFILYIKANGIWFFTQEIGENKVSLNVERAIELRKEFMDMFVKGDFRSVIHVISCNEDIKGFSISEESAQEARNELEAACTDEYLKTHKWKITETELVQ